VSGLLSLMLVQAQVVTAASPSTAAVPPTDWSCAFESAEGSRFRLSGRIGDVPAGWDPNSSRPTDVAGEGNDRLAGKASVTVGDAGEQFRDYQVGIVRGDETYHVNLKLRRGGPGIAYVTRYVYSERDPQPYSYFAAGLCTSEFGAPKGVAQ
jgi:hypothetical protein